MDNVAITGKSRIAGIIGNPVSHSLSPALHNHLFAHLNLPYVYVPLGVEPAGLATLVQSLRALRAIGANVTIPYKSAVLPLCDEISELSRVTQTVNTLWFKGDTLCGTTTDFIGFCEAVVQGGGKVEGADVVVLGNGGTARTIVSALTLEKKVASVVIAGRNKEKLVTLAEEIGRLTGMAPGVAPFGTADFEDAMSHCSLLVNCTSVGMHPDVGVSPIDARYFHKGMFVFDAIYNPAKTKFLADAEAVGCRAVNGLGMLVYQGLASFELWTGIAPSRELIDMDVLTSRIIKG